MTTPFLHQVMDHIDEAVARDELNEYVAKLLGAFVRREPERPCMYSYECVMHGRCPHDPVCNN